MGLLNGGHNTVNCKLHVQVCNTYIYTYSLNQDSNNNHASCEIFDKLIMLLYFKQQHRVKCIQMFELCRILILEVHN